MCRRSRRGLVVYPAARVGEEIVQQGNLVSTAFVLIVYLATGQYTVTLMDNFHACILRSQFEVRYDPSVTMTLCVPHSGDSA